MGFGKRSTIVCMLVLTFSSLLVAQTERPAIVAGLHSFKNVVWQRTSPNAKHPDGPVLYQIIFRSNASPVTCR